MSLFIIYFLIMCLGTPRKLVWPVADVQAIFQVVRVEQGRNFISRVMPCTSKIHTKKFSEFFQIFRMRSKFPEIFLVLLNFKWDDISTIRHLKSFNQNLAFLKALVSS